MDKSKPFGLILSKKVGKFDSKRKSVFESSSDEEIAEKGKFPKVSFPASRSKARIKVESTEDPGIYEYDNIYDEMKANQVIETKEKKKQDSRYIESLLKAATKRKKEHERRVEKKIHVEREKEGNKFKDKEEFVTSAYKKKMQEMEEEEKRESLENQMNEIMDVTKQKDLSGFYRHFLKQSVGEEKIPVFGDRQEIKQEKDAEPSREILVKQINEGCHENSKDQGKIDNIKYRNEKETHKSLSKETEKDKNKTKECILDIDLVKSQYENLDADSNSSDSDSEHEDNVPLNTHEGENSRSQKERAGVKHSKAIHLAKSHELVESYKDHCNPDSNSDTDSESEHDHHIVPLKLNKNERGLSRSQKKKTDVKYNKPKQFVENDDLTSYKYDCDADSGSESSELEGKDPLKENISRDKTHRLKKKKTNVEKLEIAGEEESEQKSKKEVKNIFAKRTVGIVFDEAQARYFERRAAQKALS